MSNAAFKLKPECCFAQQGTVSIMCMMAYDGTKSHPPLRRVYTPISVQDSKDSYLLKQDEVEPREEQNSFFSHSEDLLQGLLLPMSFVSVAVKEDGHVALRQQLAKENMSSEQQNVSSKKWHHKAIRRNISKSKELVLFVGKLPENLSSDRYLTYAAQCTNTGKATVDPIYPKLGCFFLTFTTGKAAADALKCFSLTRLEGTQPELLLLPYIHVPTVISVAECNPLLVFINCKSGGGQGNLLYDLMKRPLNPYQIFLMDKGGAASGLYAFRKLPRFRILVCGGDGTVGWVLTHLEEVRSRLQCRDPPIAVLPVGTGNDLARVLGFGSGWGGEDVKTLLAQVQDTQTVMMDRWNIIFDSHPIESDEINTSGESSPLLLSDAVTFTGLSSHADARHSRSELSLVRGSTAAVSMIVSIGGQPNGASVSPSIPRAGRSSTRHRSVSPRSSSSGSSNCAIASVDNASERLTPIPVGLVDAKDGDTSDFDADRAGNGPDVEDFRSLTDDVTLPNEKGASPVVRRQSRGSGKSPNRLAHVISDTISGDKAAPVDFATNVKDREEMLNLLRLNDGSDAKASNESSDLVDFHAGGEPEAEEGSRDAPSLQITGPEEENALKNFSRPCCPKGRHFSLAPDQSRVSLQPDGQSVSLQKKYSLPNVLSFKPSDEEKKPEPPSGLKMVAMNNYLGMGIDAELSLAFHLAREENPEKCTSRLRNKAMYFKAGLKKMTSRSVSLNNVIDLEVDHNKITLPSIKGLIFLNISSWGSGANAWGSGSSRRFVPQHLGDNLLEVVGVGGVAHMSQMYSGLRNGIRIAQGTNIKMTLKAEVAVQVDGEPWMQPPGKIVITPAAMQAAMLKRTKKKSK